MFMVMHLHMNALSSMLAFFICFVKVRALYRFCNLYLNAEYLFEIATEVSSYSYLECVS